MRPVRITVCSLLVTGSCLIAVAAPASASSGSPASGSATSGFSLARLTAGSASVSVGDVTLSAAGLAAPDAAITLTPAYSSLTGAVGRVSVTPANSPQSTGGQSETLSAGPVAVGTLTAPAFTARASRAATAATALVDATGLSAKLLGLPLSIAGVTFSDTAKMLSTGASAGKTFAVQSLGLPSLSALLGAFGINAGVLSALPISGLQNLATTVGSVVTTAQSTLTAARGVVTTTDSAWTTTDAAFSTASTALSNAVTTLNNNASGAVATALSGAGLTAPISVSQWLGLSSTVQSTIETALNTVVTGAGTALGTATSTYTSALATAQSALAALKSALSALAADVLAALNAPLATLHGIQVSTLAATGTAPSAAGVAKLGGVDVLGTALPSVDLTSLPSSLPSALSSTVGAILSALHSAAPGIKLSAPKITVAAVTKATSVVSGVQHASVTVVPLSVTLPAESVDLTGLTNGLPVTLPAVAGVAPRATVPLTSTPAVTLAVATFSDTAKYAPATAASTPQSGTAPTGTTTKSPGSLAMTGAGAGLPIAGSLALLAALAVVRLRRRRA